MSLLSYKAQMIDNSAIAITCFFFIQLKRALNIECFYVILRRLLNAGKPINSAKMYIYFLLATYVFRNLVLVAAG